MDISELGLKEQQAPRMLPRFYMKYLKTVWFILFLPGKRDGISGYSPDIDANEVSDGKEVSDEEAYDKEEQRMITKEIELAQEYDRKLTREIPPGATDIMDITKKLCGWHVSIPEGNLENVHSS